MRGEPLKVVVKHWELCTSVVLFILSIGIAQGKYSGMADRVDAIENTHPDATAALTKHNTDDVSGMRGQIDRIHDDVAATRVDVARLCVQFGLQPSRATAPTGVPSAP